MKIKRILLWVLLCTFLLSACTGNSNPTDETSSSADTTGEQETTDEPIVKEDPSMISYWSFDEIGENGLVADDSERKNGTAINCEVAKDGVKGTSLLFQPSLGAQVSFGNSISNALSQTGAMTLSFWYYPMTSMLQESTLFQLTMEDGEAGVRISVRGSTYTVGVRTNDKVREQTKTYICNGWGEWYHLTLVVDYQSGEVRFYRNGSEVAAAEGEKINFRHTNYDPGTPAYDDVLGGVGVDHFGARFFSGKIDEVYLFSKAASAKEIAALYSENRNAETPAAQESLLYAKLGIFTSTGNVVLHKDSNVVLSGGDRRFVVPGNAVHKLVFQNDTYYAPLAFYTVYFNKSFNASDLAGKNVIAKNGTKYLSVSDFSAMTGTGLKITDQGTVILGKKATSVESAVLAFIERYFAGDLLLLPVPDDDFYNSRAEVQESDLSKGISLGSPSLVKLPNGNLLASYDFNGSKYKPVSNGTNDSAVNLSTDGGKTWKKIATVPRLMWASLFTVGDTVYLVGRDTASGKLAIVKSADFGYTWTAAKDGQIDKGVTQSHRAPTPVVVHNGRVYIACEDSANAAGELSGVPTKRAYMISAPVDADLTKAASWTKSNSMEFDNAWVDPDLYYGGSYTGFGAYEGNAVAGPDGSMYIILRMDSDPTTGLACVLKLSADNKTLTFERIINLPVGKEKFAIRYDETSGKYIAIGNAKDTGSFPTQRNIVAMYYSDDLIDWTFGATLISDNSLIMPELSAQNYGYQYPDFLIDGNNILLLVREASGTTTYFHDANFITYYTVNDFRRFIK